MIQYYTQIRDAVEKFNQQNAAKMVQRIYSTTRYVCIIYRIPGATFNLVLGRGRGYEGVWLSSTLPDATLRFRDRFVEYLRAHLLNGRLQSAVLDSADRIVQFHYERGGHAGALALFWHRRDLYFAHYGFSFEAEKYQLFTSWLGLLQESSTPIENWRDLLQVQWEQLGRRSLAPIANVRPVCTFEELLQQEQQTLAQGAEHRQTRVQERKQSKIQSEIANIDRWLAFAQVMKSADPSTTTVEQLLEAAQLKMRFDFGATEYQKRDRLFTKIKRIKAGRAVQQQRLAHLEQTLQSTVLKAAVRADQRVIQPIWKSTDPGGALGAPPPVSEFEFREFVVEGIRVAVGLSAQGNDQLRNRWASKEDLWMHVEGEHGAHLVAKTDSSALLNDRFWQISGALLAHFSKISADAIPILYSQIKYIKGVKGSPGKVIVKNPKYRTIVPIRDWESLIERGKK